MENAGSNVFRRYLTEEEQRRLLESVRSRAAGIARRDCAWIALLLATGLRIGEFSRLTIGCAQSALESGWLFVPRENRKGARRGRAIDHSVPVTAPVRQALAELLDIAGAGLADQEPLVVSREGRAMSIRSYQVRLAHWCAVAGVRCSPHWLRHSRAKNIMRRSTANDPRGLVQAALGHASISSTGIYTRVDKEQLARELSVVDRGRRRAPRAQLRVMFEERVAGRAEA